MARVWRDKRGEKRGDKKKKFNRIENRREAYFAIGSGVTPYQASSVIQIPQSYRENMLWRWW